MYGMDKLVAVPSAELTAFRNALAVTAGTVGHATLADAFNKLADASLPVDNRFLAGALWAHEWGRRSGNVTLRDTAQAVLDTAAGVGFLIPEDAGTNAHVWFDRGALVDSKGNAWTLNGAVPQTDGPPDSAGPFSDANFYSLGTGNDILDFAGDFSAAVLFSFEPGPSVNTDVLLSNGTASVDGYYVQATVTREVSVVFSTLGSFPFVAAPNLLVDGLNVFCFGRSGTTGQVKLNLGTFVTGASVVITPATTTPVRLGRYANAGNALRLGRLYEVWFSTTAPSDASFTKLANDVKRQLGITAW